MAYNRGGHAGAVAVSYSTNAMPTPLSPSRRYSSGNPVSTTSGVGGSSSKLSSYRSSGSNSFDRPTSYYSSGSTSGYSSTHRSSFSSEYRRYCSPSRSLSVSSSSYSDSVAGSGSGGKSGSSSGNSRYSASRDRSETRETVGSSAISTADLWAKYSPATYVPNISGSNERHSAGAASAINGYGNPSPNNANNSTSAIFGGNAANAKISSFRDTSNELTPSIVQGRPPRAARKSPANTVINNHVQSDFNAAAEVTREVRNPDHDNNNECGNFNRFHNEENVLTCRVSNNFHYSNTNPRSDASVIPRSNATKVTNDALDPLTNSTTSSSAAAGVAAAAAAAAVGGVIGVINSANSSGFLPINKTDLLSTNTEITNNNRDAGEEDEEERQAHGLNSQIICGRNFSTLNLLKEDNCAFDRTDSNLLDLNSDGADSVVRKNLVSRPTGNQAGDHSNLPSTSRRGDCYSGNGNNSNGSSGAGNTSQTATTHQNVYRGINEQIEGSPTIRAPRNRLQTPRDERCGLNGLRNIGNTCFMNSVIQCLSNTKPLLEYLVNEQYLADINTATSSMKGALIKAFSQVIQELWEVGGDHVVNTASLKSQIQRFAPRFMGYSQQDAQEFLRYLLEGLHEDVNRVTVKPQPIHTDIPEHYTDSQKAAESWKRYLRNEDSTIVDVFVGQLRSSLHCTSCGHVSVTLDPFWDLSLPIPTRSGTVKLNQCLEHFTKEEVLDGDEKPTCSKCQMRRKCTKSFSIQKFPKILVIHLKRFSPMERFRGKLNTLVDFPLTGLDLGAFSAPRVAGCTYNLYGVANHSGTTYSGHYTAYCKHPYSGEWHEYNDSRVSTIAARSVVSSEGYVLFYEQQPHSSNL